MPLNIPTTAQITQRNLSNLESNLNQTAPANDKSFLKVLAAVEALAHTELYKLLVERSLQNLALTASGESLDKIGQEYDVIRKPAESAVLEISLPADNDSG